MPTTKEQDKQVLVYSSPSGQDLAALCDDLVQNRLEFNSESGKFVLKLSDKELEFKSMLEERHPLTPSFNHPADQAPADQVGVDQDLEKAAMKIQASTGPRRRTCITR